MATNLANFRKTSLLQSTVLTFIAGLLTSIDELEDLRRAFQAMDTDQDGTLDLDELKEGMREHMTAIYFDTCDWDDFLQSIDADKSGKIDFQEFIAAAHSRTKILNEKNLRIAFDMFDADGNGSITKEEMNAVFSGSSAITTDFTALWKEILEGADKNGNGTLEFEEFREAMHSVIN